MWGSRCALSIVALAVTAAPVAAEPDEPGAEPKLITPTGKPPATVVDDHAHSHEGQFELSLRIPIGLRAIAPYNDGVYCGAIDLSTSSHNAPVCTSRAPFSVDLELGYGVARKVDAFLELRLGLEHDFGVDSMTRGPRMIHLSPGARFFFSEARHSKLFTTGQVVFDFADYGGGRGIDFGLRNLNGIWLDLHRNYGFYAFVGETATFVRWLRFELEAGLGFQVRYR